MAIAGGNILTSHTATHNATHTATHTATHSPYLLQRDGNFW